MGSVYKGLAFSTDGTNSYLYAADFHNNKIDVTPSSGAPALTGNFTDPTLPAGYAPFNIQSINGQLYVTYALQDAAGMDDTPCPGCGYVSIFTTNGDFVQRFASKGSLNAPWGLAMAPSGWGKFSNDLLVGNFSSGLIDAYSAKGKFAGQLVTTANKPFKIPGLWALAFGNGGKAGPTTSLLFTAGINGQSHGIFGTFNAVTLTK